MLYPMIAIVYFPGAGIPGAFGLSVDCPQPLFFPGVHTCVVPKGQCHLMISARNISRVIWIHTLLIIAIGLLSLYSASFNNNVVGVSVFYDQLFCALLGIGILLMFLLSQGDYRKFF